MRGRGQVGGGPARGGVKAAPPALPCRSRRCPRRRVGVRARGSRGSCCRAGRGDGLQMATPTPRTDPRSHPAVRVCGLERGEGNLGNPRDLENPGPFPLAFLETCVLGGNQRVNVGLGGIFNCLRGMGEVGNFSIHGSEELQVVA